MKGTYVRRSMVSSHVNIYEVSIKFVVTKPPKLVKMVIASQNKLFLVLFALHVLTFAFPTEARRLSTKASSHLVHVDQNENKGLTLFKRVRFGMLAKIPILPPYNLVRKILFMFALKSRLCVRARTCVWGGWGGGVGIAKICEGLKLEFPRTCVHTHETRIANFC